MRDDPYRRTESRIYNVGLDRYKEAVISSHFMHGLANDAELDLYDDSEFAARSLEIDVETVHGRLIPALLRAADAFSEDRAAAAEGRARANYRQYGLTDPGQ